MSSPSNERCQRSLPSAEVPFPNVGLGERNPSNDDGTRSVLPEAGMQVVYQLRHDVAWQDGASFTRQDLAFSYRFLSDTGLPVTLRDTVQYIQSVDATDDWTAVF